MIFRRLWPEPGEGELGDLLDGLDLAARAPAHRPYVIADFVASADGRAARDGRSRPLGDAGDRELFLFLRTLPDAVLAGPGTLAAEPYNRLVRRPERRAARVARGLAPDPPLVTISRSGRVPEVPLAADPDSSLVVLEGEPASALGRLRAEHGVRSVLCEGGPTLFRALLAAGLVDELFLTVAPLLSGAPGVRITEGPSLPDGGPATLLALLEREGSLFARYALGSVSASSRPPLIAS